MTDESNLDGITQTIANSIASHFTEPKFDNDGGEVRFLDRVERCDWLGLFLTDEKSEDYGDRPVVT